ncbi:PQQ-like beta-propeller repeat protein [candidate division KSB1 bacterium]|nr:PQQ-like beta-propeller repeat protein [candidate division KSB1 bacterium]
MEIWRYDIQEDGDQHSFHGEMLLSDDLVIVGTDTKIGHIYAFEQRTGAVRWKYRVPGSGASTDILRSDSKIYTVADDDVLICLDLDTGDLVWQYKSEFVGEIGQLMTRSAALSGDRIFFGGSAGNVHALNKDSGELIWTKDVGAPVSTSVLANEQAVFLGTGDGYLYRLDRNTGEVHARLETELVPIGRPTLADDALYVFLSEGGPLGQGRGKQLLAVDLLLEKQLWQRQPDFVWSATKSYVWNQMLLTGTEYGETIGYNLDDGDEEWRFQVAGAVRSIGRAENMLFVGTIAGMVYAIKTGN